MASKADLIRAKMKERLEGSKADSEEVLDSGEELELTALGGSAVPRIAQPIVEDSGVEDAVHPEDKVFDKPDRESFATDAFLSEGLKGKGLGQLNEIKDYITLKLQEYESPLDKINNATSAHIEKVQLELGMTASNEFIGLLPRELNTAEFSLLSTDTYSFYSSKTYILNEEEILRTIEKFDSGKTSIDMIIFLEIGASTIPVLRHNACEIEVLKSLGYNCVVNLTGDDILLQWEGIAEN